MNNPNSRTVAPPTEGLKTEGIVLRWASTYDLVAGLFTLGQAARLRRLTLDLAALQPGESLLDVGCGTGGVTIPARERLGPAGKAAGIDPAPEMIAVSQKKARRKGLEIDFRVGVIEALPFPDGTFDVVTASLMMHHLPEGLRAKGLGEILRVLKPGGRLLVADMIGPQGSFGHRIMSAMALHHGLRFGLADLPDMIKAAGFREAALLEKHFLVIGFVRALKG